VRLDVDDLDGVVVVDQQEVRDMAADPTLRAGLDLERLSDDHTHRGVEVGQDQPGTSPDPASRALRDKGEGRPLATTSPIRARMAEALGGLWQAPRSRELLRPERHFGDARYVGLSARSRTPAGQPRAT
jgi:hypothetical protein